VPTDNPTAQIALTLTVSGGVPQVLSVLLGPDAQSAPGTQIAALPGQNAIITLDAVVESPSGLDALTEVVAAFGGDEVPLSREAVVTPTSAHYIGSVSLRYFDAPTNYSGEIRARDRNGAQASARFAFEYLSAIGLVVTEHLDMAASPGGNDTAGAQAQNIGNTALRLSVASSGLSAGTTTLEPSVLSVGLTPAASTPLTSQRQVLANMPSGAAAFTDLFFRVSVPLGTPQGTYGGRIYVYADPQ
jgi:hypothetical protein